MIEIPSHIEKRFDELGDFNYSRDDITYDSTDAAQIFYEGAMKSLESEEIQNLIKAVKFYQTKNMFTQDGFSIKFMADKGRIATKAVKFFETGKGAKQ